MGETYPLVYTIGGQKFEIAYEVRSRSPTKFEKFEIAFSNFRRDRLKFEIAYEVRRTPCGPCRGL